MVVKSTPRAGQSTPTCWSIDADVLVNGLADVVVTAPPRRRRLC
jgi:hypothetical protein